MKSLLKNNVIRTAVLFILITLLCLLLSSCGLNEKANEVADVVSKVPDPIERGLIWVAIAIVLNGVIRGIMND